MRYYLGVNNSGEEFYSKKELIERINNDKDLLEFISNGDYVTIIKENNRSRVFLTPVVVDGMVTLSTHFKELQDSFGDYGS